MLFSALSIITSYGLIKNIINYFLFRDRPYIIFNLEPLVTPSGAASFPSGHAILFFTIATLVFFWINKKWGIWFFAAAGLISLARIFVSVHFPIDVITGAFIGFVTPFLVSTFIKKYQGGRDPDEDRDKISLE